MGAVLNEEEKRAHLREVIADFDTAMLITHADDGELRARPLALAQTKDDGVIYFPTSLTSPKIRELEADPHVCVTMQDKRRFVSISGRARIMRDRPIIDALWTESWKVWFPQGKDDPDLALIAVIPNAGEYWDNKGGKGLAYLFEAARALVSGTTPSDQDDQRNAKVPV